MLICTVSCLLGFKSLEKPKMPGLEKKSVFMAAEMGGEMAAENTDKAVNEPRLHAVSAALYDADDETFIYGRNMRDSMANASTTKLLTCIVALEKADINDTVTISQNAASQPAVKLGLVAGNSYNMKDLLYGMMLESFNDCAYAIAEHVGGSTEGFAKLMNEKANEIGCLGTYFITPNGLDAENDISFHHSTAGDLCVIMSYCAWKSPKSTQFLEITQTMQYTFETEEGQMVLTITTGSLRRRTTAYRERLALLQRQATAMSQQLKRMEGECAFLSWAVGGQTIKTISGLMQRAWWSMRFQMLPKILTVMLLV